MFCFRYSKQNILSLITTGNSPRIRSVEPGVWMQYSPIPYHPLQNKRESPGFKRALWFTTGRPRLLDFRGSLFVMAILWLQETREGRVSGRPGQTVTPLFSTREHTEQPQLVSPVISLPCHMIRAVCNNTQGAGAGLVRKWDDPWLTA